MAFFEWNADFSVSVPEIDEQHKRLFQVINDFYDAIKDGRENAFGELLDSLIAYTVYHFSSEEKYMDKFNYPEAESHKREHELFTAKVLDVKKRFDDGKFVLTLEITNFLKNWITNHVLHVDKKLSPKFE